jgi:hypothetical protein
MNEKPLKPFRWVGRPSEEELLGIPFPVPRGGRRAALARSPVTAPRPTVDAPPPSSGSRLRPGEAIALLAVALVGALALGGAGNSIRFSAAQPLTAPKAHDPNPDRVTVGWVRRSPRAGSEAGPAAADVPRAQVRPNGAEPSETQTTHEVRPAPEPSETQNKQLLKATLPLLGTVTVEEPEPLAVDEAAVTEPADVLLP